MRKKLFAILMSAMMMVSFMPAMAFAATRNADNVVKDITWAADYSSATVEVYLDRTSDDTETFSVTPGFWQIGSQYQYRNGYGYLALDSAGVNSHKCLFNGRGTTVYTFTNDAVEAKVKVQKVINLAEADVSKGNYFGNPSSTGVYTVNAARYAKYIALKGTAGATPDFNINSVKIGDLNAFVNSDTTKYFDVEYPEYTALKYGQTGDLKINLTDAAKNVIENRYGNDCVYYAPGATMKLAFDVTGLNDYFTSWSVEDFDADRTQDYDGKEHAVVVDHPAENVVASYKCLKTKDAFGANIAGAVWATTEWTAEAPSIKDAGAYQILVKFELLDKDGKVWQTYQTPEEGVTYTINQKLVDVQPVATKFWKNYDGEGFTFTDKALVIKGLCDGDVLLKEAITTPANVGNYILHITDKDINENYTAGEQRVIVNADVSIYKADNKVTCPTSNKAVKYSKVKKAAQTVAVKTTSKFGEVKLTKVSGSAKLYVKDGKIVVKKGTKKGTYKIKVRAYVEGTENYASAKITKVVKVTVK